MFTMCRNLNRKGEAMRRAEALAQAGRHSALRRSTPASTRRSKSATRKPTSGSTRSFTAQSMVSQSISRRGRQTDVDVATLLGQMRDTSKRLDEKLRIEG